MKHVITLHDDFDNIERFGFPGMYDRDCAHPRDPKGPRAGPIGGKSIPFHDLGLNDNDDIISITLDVNFEGEWNEGKYWAGEGCEVSDGYWKHGEWKLGEFYKGQGKFYIPPSKPIQSSMPDVYTYCNKYGRFRPPDIEDLGFFFEGTYDVNHKNKGYVSGSYFKF